MFFISRTDSILSEDLFQRSEGNMYVCEGRVENLGCHSQNAFQKQKPVDEQLLEYARIEHARKMQIMEEEHAMQMEILKMQRDIASAKLRKAQFKLKTCNINLS